MIKKFLPVVIIILLSYWAIKPLLLPGFFPMHDDEQIARLYDLDQTLRAGNIPPRIAPNLGFGYGYPLFNFYPSFAYYVGEGFHLMGFSFIDSTKLMLVFGFIFASLFMYLLTKLFFGKLGGIVAAVVYLYAGYHGIDVYVRGAFAEFFAFVFLPLIFWAIYKVKDSPSWIYVVFGSVGVGGLILSHNLIMLMSLPFIGMWIIFTLFFTKQKVRFLCLSSCLLLLGFGLTAYFWLPSYGERSYTIVNILTSELADYHLHFVCIRQLWSSPWGYGGSIPDCSDGISFEIGKVALILSFLAIVFAGFSLSRKKEKTQSSVVLFFAGFLLFSSFLMTKYSAILWDSIPALAYIQFPWRFLLLTSFTTAVLCGGLIGYIHNSKLKLFSAILVSVLIILSNGGHFVPERHLLVTDHDYLTRKKLRWETSSLSYEYVPKGIATKKSSQQTTLIDLKETEIATVAAQVVTGSMDMQMLKEEPQYKKIAVTVTHAGILQINTFSFPGWKVFVDGKQVDYTDSNRLKLIRITLPQGKHLVEATFMDTPIRTTGNSISFISIIVFMSLLLVAIRTKKHEEM